ncbi:MAG: uracil-DNA glycosylase family protein [Candidatus ainarchaeum sp.]|nr:uracil-DNA glycosylase family protein [Candidatus ainarchaeum sp.]
MQVKSLIKKFDELQLVYGDQNLDAICGAGQIQNPQLCLVFMNPTGRNVSSSKSWKGLKAPWIGTKNVWKMFSQLGFFDSAFFKEIENKSPDDWDYEFANKVYSKVRDSSIYITNLSKATQADARHLKNEVFRDYLEVFFEEISTVKPQIIIAFGNQVSSVLLDKTIKVSDYRKKCENLEIDGNAIKVFPVYYPVGQGQRNIEKAKEDISWILKTQLAGLKL